MNSMNTLPAILANNLDAVRRLCERYSVSELRVFGSVLTGRFDVQTSDLDFVVEFADPDAHGIADRYLALADGLETLFGRPVDLITKRSVRNPVFRERVDSTSQALYAA